MNNIDYKFICPWVLFCSTVPGWGKFFVVIKIILELLNEMECRLRFGRQTVLWGKQYHLRFYTTLSKCLLTFFSTLYSIEVQRYIGLWRLHVFLLAACTAIWAYFLCVGSYLPHEFVAVACSKHLPYFLLWICVICFFLFFFFAYFEIHSYSNKDLQGNLQDFFFGFVCKKKVN